MKTAPTTKRISNHDVNQAVIVLTRPTPRTLKRGQFHTYKLCTTPADTNSPTYKLAMPFFDKGTPKEWIKFRRGLQAVLKGQNVMQGPASYAVTKTLLKGNGLMVFKQAETSHGNQIAPHFELCLDDVAANVFLGEIRTDPEMINLVQQENNRKEMGGSSFGSKQLSQGFSSNKWKPNTASQ
eukprot:6232644-Ditylum_brightwellii.AAC.1